MAGYGVPDDLEGTLPWSWAEERLVSTRNFWFVSANRDGRPHSLPVWGIWLPERQRFGFSSAPSARKVRNIAANDQVVVTTQDSVECVSIEGRAVTVDEAHLRTVAQAQGQSGSSISKPTGVPHVLRYDTSCAGRRAATPHVPVG